MRTRRQLFRDIGVTLFMVFPASALGCAQYDRAPVPFETGNVISPPLGCTEMRKVEKSADC